MVSVERLCLAGMVGLAAAAPVGLVDTTSAAELSDQRTSAFERVYSVRQHAGASGREPCAIWCGPRRLCWARQRDASPSRSSSLPPQEGRWFAGVDNAKCRSGWSAVHEGQATAAVDALETVLSKHALAAVLDVPVGDGCSAEAALEKVRKGRNVTYYGEATRPRVSDTWDVPAPFPVQSSPAGTLSPPRLGLSFRSLQLPRAVRTGLDIVESLVESNRARFGDAMTSFAQADVATLAHLPQLPPRSLVFSRQMFQHQCNEDVMKTLKLISNSNALYALVTTFKTDPDFVNTDINCASGGYRPQDLMKPPFNLSPPIAWYDEKYPADRRVGLGLWRLPLTVGTVPPLDLF